MFARVAFVLVSMLSGPVLADTNQWSYTGPAGAYLLQVQYVSGSGTLIALSHSQIVRSTDHGANWMTVVDTRGGLFPPKLVVNPANRNQALAVIDQLYRTTDGGATWTPVVGSSLPNTPNGEVVRSMAWSRDGSRVWAGTNNSGIYRSVDGGLNWSQQADLGFSSIDQLDVDAVDPDRVYASTMDGLYTTEDGGSEWDLLSPMVMGWIAASPSEPGVVLAIIAGDGPIVRSENHGVTFSPHSNATPRSLYFAPGDADRVYAFYALGDASVSTDGGATWGPPRRLFRLEMSDASVSPADPGRLVLATYAGAVASADALATLTSSSNGLQRLPFLELQARRVPGGDSRLYAASPAGNANVFSRGSDGAWVEHDAGTAELLGDPATFTTFAVAPSDGTLYLARFDNFAASADGGANWTRRSGTSSIYQMAVDPTNSLVIHGASSPFVGSRRSVDGGVTWTPMDGLPEDVVRFAVNDKHPNRVYALSSTQFTSPDVPLYVSEDSGVTWEPASWAGNMTFQGRAIAHEPGSDDTVYIGLQEGLFKTTDGGETWTQLDPYPETISPDGINSIFIDPEAPQNVYVTSIYRYPAMRSVDGGATWEPLLAADPDEVDVERVVVDPAASNRLVGLPPYGGLVELTVAPDLGLTSSGTLRAGTAGSVTLTATNHGSYTATQLRLEATLPEAVGNYGVTGGSGLGCEVVARALTCEAALLRPSATAAVVVNFTPTATGTWQASVAGREDDSATANNSLSLTVLAASSGGGGGGVGPQPPKKGGGGGLDYLLLTLLSLTLVR